MPYFFTTNILFSQIFSLPSSGGKYPLLIDHDEAVAVHADLERGGGRGKCDAVLINIEEKFASSKF
jgi:hypothetical protein